MRNSDPPVSAERQGLWTPAHSTCGLSSLPQSIFSRTPGSCSMNPGSEGRGSISHLDTTATAIFYEKSSVVNLT